MIYFPIEYGGCHDSFVGPCIHAKISPDLESLIDKLGKTDLYLFTTSIIEHSLIIYCCTATLGRGDSYELLRSQDLLSNNKNHALWH